MAENIKPGKVPAEALSYLLQRKARGSFSHEDVWNQEHSQAFAVAKAMESDVVDSIKDAVAEATVEGLPFEKFQKRLTPVLADKGWWGRQTRVDPLTGEEKEVQLGSPARLRLIYQTNMRTARAAGQWQRIQRTKKLLPKLRYRHGHPDRPRPEHVAWDGTVLPVDDPWWDTHFGQNGYGCTCWVEQVAAGVPTTADHEIDRDLIEVRNKRTGRTVKTARGVDPSFAYNPGKVRPPTGELPPSPAQPPPSDRLGDTGAEVFGRRLTDSELDDLAGMRAKLPAGASLRVAVEERKGRVRLNGDIHAEGKTVGTFTRHYARVGEETHVTHTYFKVADQYQNSGIGRAIFNAQVDAYERQGIARVKLDAADVGRYVWTKAGFEWTNPAQLPEIRTQLHTLLTERYGQDAADKTMANVKTPQDIAGLEVGEERVGKEFLLSFGWEADLIEMSQTPKKIRRL